MTTRKVKPGKPTRRPDRQGSIPEGRETQSTRKRPLKKEVRHPRKRSRKGHAKRGGVPLSPSLR